MMNIKLYTVISFIAYCFSVMFFDYYAVEYYASETESSHVASNLMLMSYPLLVAFLLALIIWLFKRNQYWSKFIGSLLFLSLVLLAVNFFAIYLMYWSVNT